MTGKAAMRVEVRVLPAACASAPGWSGVWLTGWFLDSPGGLGAGGQSAAPDAVMVVEDGERSRGGRPKNF